MNKGGNSGIHICIVTAEFQEVLVTWGLIGGKSYLLPAAFDNTALATTSSANIIILIFLVL